MERAFQLAEGVLGTTSPNPAVGAVVVRSGELVGEGATQPPGRAHAEALALRAAGTCAQGAVLYATLEPCAHHGRTPPCTDAIIDAGIATVVVATVDPDEQVDGRGLTQLREAGIDVVVGDGSAVGADHYESYFHHRRSGRPFVAAKFAASLDGRIASTSGDSRWISGPETLAWAHQMRPRLDAILVGVETIIVDNPQLTARPAGAARFVPQPLRVVLDSRGRTPPNARVLDEQKRAPTLIATTAASPLPWREAVAARGAETVVLPSEGGRTALAPLLDHLGGERGVVSLLVEGGGEVHGSFLDQRLVNKVYAVIAPMLIGGSAQTAVRGAGARRMADALRLNDPQIEQLGTDLLISGYPYAPTDADHVRLRPAGTNDVEAVRALLASAGAPARAEETLGSAGSGNLLIWLAEHKGNEALEGAAAAALLPDQSAAQLAVLVMRRGAAPQLATRLRESIEASCAGRGRRWMLAAPGSAMSAAGGADALRAVGYRYFRRDGEGRDLFIKPLAPDGEA